MTATSTPERSTPERGVPAIDLTASHDEQGVPTCAEDVAERLLVRQRHRSAYARWINPVLARSWPHILTYTSALVLFMLMTFVMANILVS